MLEITIPPRKDLFDEETEEFISFEGAKLQLEHSLISLHRWESKWHKPFMETKEKTYGEIIDYIRCMTLNKNVNPMAYLFIPEESMMEILNYINDPMTAAKFSNQNGNSGVFGHGEYVTAETIYYWMITLNIPPEYEKWHLNQLLTLIKFVSIKNSPPKKMSKKDASAQRAALNKARRAKYNSKG